MISSYPSSRNCSNSKQQSFSGIVKKCPVAEFGGRTNKTLWQSYFYFPFLDERPDEFIKFAKKRDIDQTLPVSVDYPEWGVIRRVVKHVKKDVLPFTKNQWDMFCKNPNALSDNVSQMIENSIKRLKL